MRRQLLGYAYLALAMALVGSTVIASKVIAHGLPPFMATALRFAIAFPLFLVLVRITATTWPALTRKDWGILVIQAAAGSVGYTTLLISGLRLSSAADAGVIIGTLPVVSAAIAIVVLGERPQRILLFAIALASIGVLAIVFQSPAGGDHSLLGNALVFGAVICEGLFILLNKRLKTSVPPLALSALMAGIGLVAATIPALFELRQMVEQSSIAMITAASLWAVIYYALVPTVGGFVLWYAGAARVSGAEASLFTAVAPVTALLLAVVLLGERVEWNQVLGIACVLMAVLCVGWPGAPRGMRRFQ